MKEIRRGQLFWLILDPDSVGSVRHEWDHPSTTFPTAPVIQANEGNKWIAKHAEEFRVPYDVLMAAADTLVNDNKTTQHPLAGTLSDEEKEKLDERIDMELSDFWYEWSEETGHEFENIGSACCAEYDYPGTLFTF